MVSTLSKVTCVVTGVAGAPYYVTGYFDRSVGTAAGRATAWMNLVTLGNTAAGLTGGSSWTIGPELPILDTASGDITGVDTITPVVINGTGSPQILPHANQYLLRWKTTDYLAGRKVIGHTNLPLAQASTSTTQGDLNNGAIISINSNIAAFFANANGALCIYSRKGAVGARVTSGSVAPFYSVLRSRRD